MNQPTPAIVTQRAVKRLPRLALVLFCLAYVLPGFVGRVPWKRDDITTFGYIAELARGGSDWWAPTLAGLPIEADGLLPYWIGASAMRLAPNWVAPDMAARLPFMGMLLLTLVAVWYGIFSLARHPSAQPVVFAFGGEANPTDYARALADGGLLALMACLGLAQLAHETTPALAQLCFTSLLFYGASALPYRSMLPGISSGVGLIGLTLSGAPTVSLLLGLGCSAIYLLTPNSGSDDQQYKKLKATGLVVLALSTSLLANWLDLWRWRIMPPMDWTEWQSIGRLMLWFTWPAWPMALWTLWRWRRQLLNVKLVGLHLWLPAWFILVTGLATVSTSAAERSLLLALPALAALAAFALPTLERSVGALIDWFTLVFFTGCALIIWGVWISMQTGVPAQPSVNVARLAPGFVHSFSITAFTVAVLATLAWGWLVKWRVGRHRAAIWKSVVLPAGGAALSWLLLMTLWLPLLDYARSYAPLVAQTTALMSPKPTCVNFLGLNRSQVAAFQFHGNLNLESMKSAHSCEWLIADLHTIKSEPNAVDKIKWQMMITTGHPAEREESILLFKRLN